MKPALTRTLLTCSIFAPRRASPMWLSRPRSKTGFLPAVAGVLLGLILASDARSQTAPVRRAQPANEPPVARALPVDQNPAPLAPRVAPTPGVESTAPANPSS